MDNIKDILKNIIKYMLGNRANREVISGTVERKQTMNTSKEPIDDIPRLDIGVAVDHNTRAYQIQLYGAKIDDEAGVLVAVLPPQRLEHILRTLNGYINEGYIPVGEGTMYPDVRLPCQAETVLEKWK